MRFLFAFAAAVLVSACGLFLDTDPPTDAHDASVDYDAHAAQDADSAR